MAGIRVVSDSASDLPRAMAAELGIDIVPLSVSFGDQTFRDGIDLSPKDFWARCTASPVLPETAAPSAGAFEQRFRQAVEEGADGVVCITMSSDMSATHQAALLAAKAVSDAIPVKVIDTRSVSMGEGLVAIAAAEMANAGKAIEDVAGSATERSTRVQLYACIDNLEFLKKGGRISSASALLGSMLSIKPVITVSGGVVGEESKPRTRTRGLRQLIDKVRDAGPIDRIAVMHAEAPDLEEFLDLLDDVVPRDQALVGDIGAVVGAHVGPRVLGVTFTTAG